MNVPYLLRVQMLTRDLDRGRTIESVQLRRQLGQIGAQVQVIQRILTATEEREENS